MASTYHRSLMYSVIPILNLVYLWWYASYQSTTQVKLCLEVGGILVKSFKISYQELREVKLLQHRVQHHLRNQHRKILNWLAFVKLHLATLTQANLIPAHLSVPTQALVITLMHYRQVLR